MTGVRWREDTGFEGRCDYCREYWPLTLEFWQVSKVSMRSCKACIREYYRVAQARRREDPEKREADRRGVAEMKATLRKYGLMSEYQHRWYMNNREKLCADRRAKYKADREAAGLSYTPRGEDSNFKRERAA